MTKAKNNIFMVNLNMEDRAPKEIALEAVLKIIDTMDILMTPIVRNEKQAIVGYKPEVWKEWKYNKNAAIRLLRNAVEKKLKFISENLQDLYSWELDKELVTEALRNSAGRLTTEDIEEFYITVDDRILLEVCKKGNIPIPEDLREYDEEIQENETQRMNRTELLESYDYVLQCLYHAHEKMNVAFRLSMSDVGSKKQPISILKHACLMEAEPFIDEARATLEEIESQVQDKISVQNTRLNMGKWIVFHDVWGDGFFTDWMVQRRIRKMMKAVEEAYKDVQKLKEKL